MLDTLKANYGSVLSFTTCVVIIGCNKLFINGLYPPNLRQSSDVYRRWKWRNFFISFIHSVVTGFGSLLCVLYNPKLLIDVIDEYLEAIYILTSVSHGYFVYDLIEMLTHIQYKGNKELVFHHILILMCFSLTVTQQIYCGYSSIALLIELSNIFLHFRQLLLISNTSKSSPIYKINCFTNIVMFIMARGSALVWLWVTLFWVLSRVAIIPKMIALTTLTSICGMTCILFKRVINSDFTDKYLKQSYRKSLTNAKPTGAQSKCKDQSSNGNNTGINSEDYMHSKRD